MKNDKVIDLGLFFTMFGVFVISKNFIANALSSTRLSYLLLILSRYQSFIFATILLMAGIKLLKEGYKSGRDRVRKSKERI